MSLAAEIQQIRDEIAKIKRQRNGRRLDRDGRGVLAVRVSEQLADHVRAIAKHRGIPIGRVVSEGLLAALNDPVNSLPENLTRFRPSRKHDHFHDGKSPRTNENAREATAAGYARSGAMIAAGAAVYERLPAEQGKLSETVARPVVPRIVPKPSR